MLIMIYNYPQDSITSDNNSFYSIKLCVSIMFGVKCTSLEWFAKYPLNIIIIYLITFIMIWYWWKSHNKVWFRLQCFMRKQELWLFVVRSWTVWIYYSGKVPSSLVTVFISILHLNIQIFFEIILLLLGLEKRQMNKIHQRVRGNGLW